MISPFAPKFPRFDIAENVIDGGALREIRLNLFIHRFAGGIHKLLGTAGPPDLNDGRRGGGVDKVDMDFGFYFRTAAETLSIPSAMCALVSSLAAFLLHRQLITGMRYPPEIMVLYWIKL